MGEIFLAIRTFMEAGGDVLYLIAAATFVMWALIFERTWYLNREHVQDVANALSYWEERSERTSWRAHMIRQQLFSEVNVRLGANMGFIKTNNLSTALIGAAGDRHRYGSSV